AARENGAVTMGDLSKTPVTGQHLQAERADVLAAAFSPDGRRLVTGEGVRGRPLMPNEVKLWDLAGGTKPISLKGHNAAVSSVAYAPDGRSVASGDAQGILRMWDTATHQQRFTRKAHARMIRGIVYAPDSKTVITVDGVYQSPGEIKLWEVATGTELARLGRH